MSNTSVSSYNVHAPSLPKVEIHWRHHMCKLGPPGAHPPCLTWEVVFTATIGVRAEQAHLIMEACGKAPTRAQGPSNIPGSV